MILYVEWQQHLSINPSLLMLLLMLIRHYKSLTL